MVDAHTGEVITSLWRNLVLLPAPGGALEVVAGHVEIALTGHTGRDVEVRLWWTEDGSACWVYNTDGPWALEPGDSVEFGDDADFAEAWSG